MKRRSIKVVHVTTVPESLNFLRSQAAYLKSRGMDVEAVSSPGPVLEAFGRSENIPVHGVAMPRRITPFGDLLALVRLVRLFRRIRPDVVHSHTPKGGLLGMIAAWLAGIHGRVYTLHGLPLETATGLKRMLLQFTERVSCALARRVLAVSPSLRKKALALGLCSSDRIEVLGAGTVNGVDAEHRFAPGPDLPYEAARVRRSLNLPSEARVVGFVGRVVRDKGVEDLVRAWTRLREEFTDLHLVVVGRFEPQDPISAEADRLLRTDPRVRVAGWVESMRSAYSVMDVVALPTYREGFPQVPLEASAMERPVVAAAVTGSVDAVRDGETGTLVPPRNPDTLAEALGTYLRDPELRARHGRAARLRVLRDYRPERLMHLTGGVYEKVVSIPRGDRAPARPPRRPIDLLIKRTLDVSGALLGLSILSPVYLVVALLIWAVEGRPILFRQRRPGLKGRIFSLVKFRSMRPGPLPDTLRTGWLGKLLRSTSLDELPQLWNVLVGDMSLVGPRPLLVQYLARYSREEARRHDVRPGITGAAQANGRNALTWPEKFALDVWYVDHGSLRVDLQILLKTLKRVVHRSGINGPGNAAVPEFKGNPRPLESEVSLGQPARG